MFSPRLIPVPGSPTNPASFDPPPISEDTGPSSESFDQKCAPSQAPERESGNSDHFSRDQLRNLCKSRRFRKKDAKAVLKTRLEGIDAVTSRPLALRENDMDTSSSVLGKTDRSMAEPSNIETSTPRVGRKRPRGGAPATTLPADLAVARAHAQWWSPDLKPKIEASQSRLRRAWMALDRHWFQINVIVSRGKN